LQLGGQLIARRNFHLVLNAIVIRQDDVAARCVAKQSDDCRMRAIQNANDSPLGALALGTGSDAAQFDLHMVAVHGVADRVARNKNVAIEIWHRLVGYHEAVAVLVQDQPARKRITVLPRPRNSSPIFRAQMPFSSFPATLRALWTLVPRLSPPPGQNKTPARQFLYSLSFLQFN